MRFARLFNDELTLDNLERVQLVSMCHFVGISPFGTDAFLRSRLRKHLGQIKNDDYAIEQEGAWGPRGWWGVLQARVRCLRREAAGQIRAHAGPRVLRRLSRRCAAARCCPPRPGEHDGG